MHDELEAALQELEGKLPDLRHLIADSGAMLTLSPAAQVLAARLLRAVTAADEVASLLRLTLLNGGELVAPTAQPTYPPPPESPLPVPSPPEPPAINPAEIVATGSGLTDSDYALGEALGLIPTSSTSFEEAIGELETTADELEQAAEEAASETTDAVLASFVDDLSDETLDTVEKVMAAEEKWNRQLEELRMQTSEALDEKNPEKARQLIALQRRLEQALSRLSNFGEKQRSILSGLTEKLSMKPVDPEPSSDPGAVLREAFRLTGHFALDTFADIRNEYTAPLEFAVNGYLRNIEEAIAVTQGAMEQSERVWNAAEGEVSVLELLASATVQQIERFIPRFQGEERYIPSAKQVFQHLARHRIERLIKDIEQRLERLRADNRESSQGPTELVTQEMATLQRLRDEVVRQFYNGLLRLDDEDETGDGGAVGARITPPPPVRDPGAGRTFDEALALARNP